TITMQVSRIFSPGRPGLAGKIREMALALCLEARYTKNEILNLYLNSIPFGHQVEGLTSASRYFFGKTPSELSRAAACVLVVIPRNPSLYGPGSRNPDAPGSAVLALAEKAGLGTEEADEAAELARTLEARPYPFKAPHFVQYLKAAWPEELSGEAAVKTSLDLELNTFIEERLNFYLARYQQNRLTNGAALVIDNKTAEIIAYVGSRDFFDTLRPGQMDGVRAANQPGSCLKPFLYAMALEKGYQPNTILPDLPLDLGGPEVFVPMNFDNRFHGPVRFRVALASSLNVPAVYLVSKLGADRFSRFLINAGFDSLKSLKANPGEGIALGSEAVSLFELVQAFSVFPRGGEFRPLIPSAGEAFLGVRQRETHTVCGRYSAALICDILSDNFSRLLGFGPNPVYNTAFPSMWKTGTANQFQHIWALGATPEYTVGIWLGNFTGETVIGSTGSSIPAKIAVEILEEMGPSGRPFQPVPDSRRAEICALSGGSPGPACGSTLPEYFRAGVNPEPCAWHHLERGTSSVSWPPLFAAWAASRKPGAGTGLSGETFLEITQPRNGSVFFMDPGTESSSQGIRIEAAGTDGGPAEVTVNGIKTAVLTYPYSYFFQLKPGNWRVTIRTAETEASVQFQVKP
ncbi:MAG: peptidoglycan glycosyltransferase, partial [Spirochaetales bacterium]